MKRYLLLIPIIMLLSVSVFAQGEAGAVWLLIRPGARACGMGEVGGAVADDAYATYYNPAGLGFQSERELSVMHTKWLPNLASDLYYDFIGYKQYFQDYGTIGGNVTIMNLGEQTRTDETGNKLGTFRSYMLAATGSYGTRLSRTASFGLNVKLIHQHLTDRGAGAEQGDGNATNFAFDIGYLKKEFLLNNLSMGLSIQNIGNKITFIDAAQADPMPTNLKLGLNYEIKGEHNSLKIAYDLNKLLVTKYPDRDIDGDGKVGYYNEEGEYVGPQGEYNADSKHEAAHSESWYTAIFTSWVDDWLLLHDSAADGIGEDDEDGDTDDGKLSNELEKLVHNFGIEYWYANRFAVRVGFIYDKAGDITMKGKYPVPTFGAGLRYAGMGFDFGYTAGEQGHPRANTMHFSMNIAF